MDTDQRKSFRILAPEGQVHAVLRVGRRSVTVRVVDSSAGGFALACQEVLSLKLGDVLRLRTNAGWHEVRVARQETYTDGLLLGVRRLHDIDDPREAECGKSRWMDYFCLPYLQGGGSGKKTTGLLRDGALVCAVLVGMACLLATYRLNRPNQSIVPQAADQFVNKLAHQARQAAARLQGETADQTQSTSPVAPTNRSK